MSLRDVGGNPAAPPYNLGPYTWDKHVALERQSLPQSRYELVERFNRTPQLNATIDAVYTTEAARNASLDFELLGTNAVDTDVTFATTIGGIAVASHGATGDYSVILPHLDTGQSAWTGVKWGTENQVIWEAIVRTGSSVAAATLWAGLKLTNVATVATDDDQAYFRYDTSPANWTAVVSIGGVDVEKDLGATYAAVTADTNYALRIEIDKDRKAHFYVNNRELYISDAMTNDVDLIPYIGVLTITGSAVKVINIASQKISRIIFE